jgi:nifR3 family TIM-barrel protein
MEGFWKKLTRPFFVLAPLANVTDAAFRRVIAEKGKPDVFWTEFVSADGLDSSGREALLTDLLYSEDERPIVAQLFSSKPEKIFKAAALVRELGFDGIDINMGCPDRAVMKQGAGAALLRNTSLAAELIHAAREGGGLPVSVKIRLGDTKNDLDSILPILLQARPVAITVHGRTRKELSKVPARWNEIARAVVLRDEWSRTNNIQESEQTLIIGNGDVTSRADAKEKAALYGVDGVMLGRAIFGNPWLFSEIVSRDSLSQSERLRTLLYHAELFDAILGASKPFHLMRKHFGSYVAGFRDAKNLREKLMRTETLEDVRSIVESELAKPEGGF